MSFQSFGGIVLFSDSSTPGFVQIFESKIQHFFQTFFSKIMIFFSTHKIIKQVIKGDLKKLRKQRFSL